MKVTRKIIEIDEELCDGCGLCVPSCAEGSLEIVDGKARVVSDNLCDGLGACLGECPQGALSIVEREAYEFDEAAVEKYLAQKQEKKTDRKTGCLWRMPLSAAPEFCVVHPLPGSQSTGNRRSPTGIGFDPLAGSDPAGAADSPVS